MSRGSGMPAPSPLPLPSRRWNARPAETGFQRLQGAFQAVAQPGRAPPESQAGRDVHGVWDSKTSKVLRRRLCACGGGARMRWEGRWRQTRRAGPARRGRQATMPHTGPAHPEQSFLEQSGAVVSKKTPARLPPRHARPIAPPPAPTFGSEQANGFQIPGDARLAHHLRPNARHEEGARMRVCGQAGAGGGIRVGCRPQALDPAGLHNAVPAHKKPQPWPCRGHVRPMHHQAGSLISFLLTPKNSHVPSSY